MLRQWDRRLPNGLKQIFEKFKKFNNFLKFELGSFQEMMNELSSEEMLFADDETRADISAKFLRHLTYNHNEVVKAVMSEVKSQKRSPEFDLYK